MPAQDCAAPIAISFIMPNKVARGPIRSPGWIKWPILTARDMHAGIDLEAPGHAARAGGNQQPAGFFARFWEIGAAAQIERIGMQPAFIQCNSGQQPFRHAMGDFGLACGNKAGSAG